MDFYKDTRILLAICLSVALRGVVTMSEQHHSLNEHEVRAEKVRRLAEKNISAWPEAKHVEHTVRQLKDFFTATESATEGVLYTIAGRLKSIRSHGKTIFANLQDRTGTIQIYINKNDVETIWDFIDQYVDIGDIVWAVGTLFRTKMGEITLHITDFSLLSKALRPLPDKFHGVTDLEHRYRQRYLDTIMNEESKEKFMTRFRIIQIIRNELLKHDFLEVETPMLHVIPGGAAARPFVTHHNAYNTQLFLRIAPELYLKRLVVGGFERVFEINRNFRNEGVSTKHNPEFTMLEFYRAHGDVTVGMKQAEDLIHAAARGATGNGVVTFGTHEIDLASPFKRCSLKDSLVEIGGFAPEQVSPEGIDIVLKQYGCEHALKKSYGEKTLALFDVAVESKIIQPTFITDYPVEVSPLAKRREDNSELAARFELFVVGMELANGFSELNNPWDQAARFHEQAASRAAGDDEAHFYDADFVTALEHGLPPTVGVGIGIDRLVMLLTNTTSIKDVILFPTMKRLE